MPELHLDIVPSAPGNLADGVQIQDAPDNQIGGPAASDGNVISANQGNGLEIDGSDLIAAGVPEGTELGRGLREALHRKLDGEVEGRDEELAAALAAARAE